MRQPAQAFGPDRTTPVDFTPDDIDHWVKTGEWRGVLHSCARDGIPGIDWWTERHKGCTRSFHVSVDCVIHCRCECHSPTKPFVPTPSP